MKKRIIKISKFVVLVVAMLCYSGIQINAQEAIPFEGGKWQAIIDSDIVVYNSSIFY